MMNLHADLDRQLSHSVCPGRIVVCSHEQREVTFYTFGGSIESESLSGETVFSLRSTAPIDEETAVFPPSQRPCQHAYPRAELVSENRPLASVPARPPNSTPWDNCQVAFVGLGCR